MERGGIHRVHEPVAQPPARGRPRSRDALRLIFHLERIIERGGQIPGHPPRHVQTPAADDSNRQVAVQLRQRGHRRAQRHTIAGPERATAYRDVRVHAIRTHRRVQDATAVGQVPSRTADGSGQATKHRVRRAWAVLIGDTGVGDVRARAAGASQGARSHADERGERTL